MSDVIYQFRHKETNEGCVNFGKWSKWESCSYDKYSEIFGYIKSGYQYETRRSLPLKWIVDVPIDSDKFKTDWEVKMSKLPKKERLNYSLGEWKQDEQPSV